jgi:hypothetical protein
MLNRKMFSGSSLATVVALAALMGRPNMVSAAPCITDGGACRTNQSCCGKLCYNSQPPGKRPKGGCCTPTTCQARGAQCGTIPNGTCYDFFKLTLDCGGCPTGEVCTGNVCVTTTSTTSSTTTTTTPCTPNCTSSHNCGDDGCGNSCGTCQPPTDCTYQSPDGPGCAAAISCQCAEGGITLCGPQNLGISGTASDAFATCQGGAAAQCTGPCSIHGGTSNATCLAPNSCF